MGWVFTDDPDAYAERVWDLLTAEPALDTVATLAIGFRALVDYCTVRFDD